MQTMNAETESKSCTTDLYSLVASVIGTFVLTSIIYLLLRLFVGLCFIKKRERHTKHVQDNGVERSKKEPVYEKLKLENKADIIDVSKNIAYEQVIKSHY